MTRRQLRTRIRARLHRDERGFTIIETMVAVTIIFASLVTLAMAASTSFRYIALARERQSATGLATQVLEQVKALDTTTIAKGMLTSDLLTGEPSTGDRIVTGCSGDPAGVYRYPNCAGDKIVHSSTASASPLVPHVGTVSSGYPTAMTYRAYVTNNDPAKYPFAVTVEVTWTGGPIGSAQSIRVQSFSYSPKGCTTTSVLHPFAGACQPFFTGTALQTQATISIKGTYSGQAVDTTLYLPYAEARLDAEQVSQIQARASQGGASSGTSTTGNATILATADGNPSTTTGVYDPASPATPPETLTVSPSTLTVLGAPNAYTLSAGSTGAVGWDVAATTASATAKCPPLSALTPTPSGTPLASPQTDNAPCGWARVQQNGENTASLNITEHVGGPGQPASNQLIAGQAVLVRVAAAAKPTDALADKVPAGSTAGRLDTWLSRTLGTVQLFGIPAGIANPLSVNPSLTGMDAVSDSSGALNATTGIAACTGGPYLIGITGYTDTVSASAGLNATAPSASVASGATVKLWNPGGSPKCLTYTSAGLSSGSAQGPASFTPFTVAQSKRVAGKAYEMSWTVTHPDATVDPAHASFGGTTVSRTPSSGTTITNGVGAAKPPADVSMRYQIVYTPPNTAGPSVTLADLTITINLGSLTATAQYAPAPTGG